jgi:hypothetical protein
VTPWHTRNLVVSRLKRGARPLRITGVAALLEREELLAKLDELRTSGSRPAAASREPALLQILGPG